MTTTSPADHRQHPVPARPRVVLATENQGKVRELRDLIGDIADVIDLKPLDLVLPPETGATFEENAIAKARFAAKATGMIAVADDSGLEVDALGGLPGVRSARYAGENATDAENRSKLLSAMREIPDGQRGARFVSVIAIVEPDGTTITTEGTCAGSIAHTERGTGGFGYDSLFLLESGRTMAEISAAEKNAISHRGAAMRAASGPLRALLVEKGSSSC
ncbi:MAG: RdgB/HAM1 family non-canonical purine NTP pyrophosphatase [Thermomicrobiales bacterium]